MQWTAVSRVVASLCLLAVTACTDDSPSEPPLLSIDGSWAYVETYDNAEAGVSCQDEGTLTIQQTGETFSGSFEEEGVCTDSEGATSGTSGSGSAGGGQLSGSDVSFVSGGCAYEGTISGTPPNRMTGDVSCTEVFGGTSYAFSGTWTAAR